jgi:hypothetical protein
MSSSYRFIYDNSHILKELDETGLHAINAVGLQVAKKHTCMIAKEGEQPEPIGSGTFVQLDGRLFVATAKHLFEDFRVDEPVGIYWGEEDNRAGVTIRNIILDDKLDLAAIPLPPNPEACGVSLKYKNCNNLEAEPDLFVISGIPEEKCKINRNSRTLIVGHFSLGLVSLPWKFWPTNSEEPIYPSVDLLLHYTRDLAIDGHGKPMQQIDPHGLSGGGIWSVPKISRDTICLLPARHS